MTTTELVTGAVIVVLVARQLRSALLEHVDAERPTPPLSWTGWGAGARWVVSVGVRLGFLVWLSDVTDGAALSPWSFAQDATRGTVWHPVLVALGLTEVVGQVAALAVRAVTSRRPAAAEPAVPVPTD